MKVNEASYKQDSNPRYHARCGSLRAKANQAALVLVPKHRAPESRARW